ncbi:hypothetical protein ACOME3_002153 [Neoechinorhynchus agilis]
MVLNPSRSISIPEDVSEWSGAEQELSERLEHISIDSLRRLSDEPDQINSLIDDLEIVKGLERHKRTCRERNCTLATSNLSREPELIAAKEDLTRLYEDAQSLSKRYEELWKMHESACCESSQEMSWIRIQTAASSFDAETEAESQKVLKDRSSHEDLMDEHELSSFLSDYVNKRTLCYLLKAKSDRLGSMIRESGGFSFM